MVPPVITAQQPCSPVIQSIALSSICCDPSCDSQTAGYNSNNSAMTLTKDKTLGSLSAPIKCGRGPSSFASKGNTEIMMTDLVSALDQPAGNELAIQEPEISTNLAIQTSAAEVSASQRASQASTPESETTEDDRDSDYYDDQEKTYCVCQRTEDGSMIACDSPSCPYEWFHGTCVGLESAPPGAWICPVCENIKKKRNRDRQNVESEVLSMGRCHAWIDEE